MKHRQARNIVKQGISFKNRHLNFQFFFIRYEAIWGTTDVYNLFTEWVNENSELSREEKKFIQC